MNDVMLVCGKCKRLVVFGHASSAVPYPLFDGNHPYYCCEEALRPIYVKHGSLLPAFDKSQPGKKSPANIILWLACAILVAFSIVNTCSTLGQNL